MSSTTSDLIKNLNTATYWINNIVPIVQIAFGTFGNLFNIIIFTRPALVTNPCSLYFLVGSLNALVTIYGCLLARYLASTWNLDPSASNDALCKLRNFFTYTSLTVGMWLTVLASIDRFLSSSTSVQLRRMSSLPRARKSIVFTTIVIAIIWVHILVFFKIGPSGPGTINCIFSPYEYIVFLSFFGPIVSYILPIVFMSIFGILMIRNVRNVRNRVVAQGNNVQNERFRSRDRQLIIMLLFQVLITTLISTPYFALNIYNAIVTIILQEKLSTSGLAIYNFILNISRLSYYTNPVISFYIYTLTGSKFRDELKRCILYGLKSVLGSLGLIQYLPLRTQQVLVGQNQPPINNQAMALRRRINTVHPIQTQKSTNMTAVA